PHTRTFARLTTQRLYFLGIYGIYGIRNIFKCHSNIHRKSHKYIISQARNLPRRRASSRYLTVAKNTHINLKLF
ncbi:MAG: hypothetical protein LBB74_07455, partial [Chitinispirillales bacterium]|nr:hypothetical protein [Chitinispirillales bacterium]